MTLALTRRSFLAGGLAALGAALAGPKPGLATAGPTPLDHRPIILVNGYADQSSIWRRTDNLVTAGLLRAGYRLDGASLLPFAFPPSPLFPDLEDSQGDIVAAGLALATTIAAAATWSPTRQVDVVGFSMGGLVTRSALNALRLVDPNGTPLVHNAVLIGTPNRGVDVLRYLQGLTGRAGRAPRDLAREYAGIDLETTAALQMIPDSDFLRDLNTNGRNDPRVRFVTIAGAGRVRLGSGGEVSVGDGVVSHASATYLPGAPSSAYAVHDVVDASLSAIVEAVQRSIVFHPRLIFSDAVAAAAVSELQPAASESRSDLEWFARHGYVTLERRAAE